MHLFSVQNTFITGGRFYQSGTVVVLNQLRSHYFKKDVVFDSWEFLDYSGCMGKLRLYVLESI